MRNERRILETQELMRQRSVPPPEPVADWPPINPDDPFDLFEVGMRALGESPLGEHDKAVLEDFAPLRLRPGRKSTCAPSARPSARRSSAASPAPATRSASPAALRHDVNGWSYPQRNLGNFGDDYLYRAVIALTALAALEVAEATYLMCDSDAEGRPLDGRHATGCASRPASCRRPRPSGRSPCTR